MGWGEGRAKGEKKERGGREVREEGEKYARERERDGGREGIGGREDMTVSTVGL